MILHFEGTSDDLSDFVQELISLTAPKEDIRDTLIEIIEQLTKDKERIKTNEEL